MTSLTDDRWRDLIAERADHPDRALTALRGRARRPLLTDGRLFIVAADHTARGCSVCRVSRSRWPTAGARSRRCWCRSTIPVSTACSAVPTSSRSWRCSGRSNNKLAFGTMNRGGVMGASWELDDRMTAYDAQAIAECGLDGGKVLLRLADDDAGTASTIEACARAVSECARRGLPIMVEPLPYHHESPGRAKLLDDDDALLRAVAVGASLGYTSSSTWLKVPAAKDPARMLACTTLPALILGGSPGPDPEATYESWAGCDGGAERSWTWSSGGRCCIPPMATSHGPSIARPRIVRPGRSLMTLHRPHGSLADGADPIALTPDDAGWSFTGLRVLSLAPGVERSIATGDIGGVRPPDLGNRRDRAL